MYGLLLRIYTCTYMYMYIWHCIEVSYKYSGDRKSSRVGIGLQIIRRIGRPAVLYHIYYRVHTYIQYMYNNIIMIHIIVLTVCTNSYCTKTLYYTLPHLKVICVHMLHGRTDQPLLPDRPTRHGLHVSTM